MVAAMLVPSSPLRMARYVWVVREAPCACGDSHRLPRHPAQGVRVTDVYDDIPGMKRVTTGSTLHSMATLG